MEEILEILEGNSRYTDEQIAVMAGKTVEEVREAIRDYEEKNIHFGNSAGCGRASVRLQPAGEQRKYKAEGRCDFIWCGGYFPERNDDQF